MVFLKLLELFHKGVIDNSKNVNPYLDCHGNLNGNLGGNLLKLYRFTFCNLKGKNNQPVYRVFRSLFLCFPYGLTVI